MKQKVQELTYIRSPMCKNSYTKWYRRTKVTWLRPSCIIAKNTLTISELNLNCKDIAINRACKQHRNRHLNQWNTCEIPDKRQCSYSSLIFDKEANHNITHDRLNVLQENTGNTLQCVDFPNTWLVTQTLRSTMTKWDCKELKFSYTAKDTIIQVKRQPTKMEKNLTSYSYN